MLGHFTGRHKIVYSFQIFRLRKKERVKETDIKSLRLQPRLNRRSGPAAKIENITAILRLDQYQQRIQKLPVTRIRRVIFMLEVAVVLLRGW